MDPKGRKGSTGRGPGEVRIIGGRLRGRKLPVPDAPGLRPSADRLRETLFNWLSSWIEDARCLDLFAGTGVLGLEAWSRGAARVQLLERDPTLAAALRREAERLGATGAEVICVDALAWLRSAEGSFDIVFLDPPFAAGLWRPALELLCERGLLAAQALVYVEHPLSEDPEVPGAFLLHRESRAGAVRGALYRLAPTACPT